MSQPHINPENDSIKKAFIATSIAMYLQACHLQMEEDSDAVMLSFLLANANSGQSGDSGTGKGNSSGQAGKGNSGNDDDSDDHNLGSGLVNNVGRVTEDSDVMGAGDIGRRRPDKRAAHDMDEEAATSPGGTGESRIVGGANPEEDDIDWTDVTDKGTKDADAATS